MRLADYLTEHKISNTAFAKMIGTSVSTVYRILGGEVFPTADNILAIKRVTHGKVTSDDLLTHAQQVDRKNRTRVE